MGGVRGPTGFSLPVGSPRAFRAYDPVSLQGQGVEGLLNVQKICARSKSMKDNPLGVTGTLEAR